MKRLPLFLTLALGTSAPAWADSAEEIWKAKCKSCHGEDGRADTKQGKKENIPDISTADWQGRHTDAQIREVISEGSKDNKKMKAYKEKLTPGEIDSVVQYVRALKAK
jgi:mono/diheme cytochrome c family protein